METHIKCINKVRLNFIRNVLDEKYIYRYKYIYLNVNCKKSHFSAIAFF